MINPTDEKTVGAIILGWGAWVTAGALAAFVDRKTTKDIKARLVRIENILLKQFGAHDD